jgi:radical SAM protein with 4Fe4S-binding SPASM domain
MKSAKPAIPLFERLLIESQSNCNRSCWFCPRTYDLSGKYLAGAGKSVLDQMPTEKILNLLEQARDLGFHGQVGFHHFSEPLLDKRNIMLADEAKKRGMKPYLHTNGDVLRRDDRMCAEVKRVYTYIVVGLYDYRSEAELADDKQYWTGRLAGANLKFSAIGASGRYSGFSMAVPKALVPTDPRMAAPDLAFSNGPCHRPLIRLIVQYDGTVCHCCEDTSGAFELGNAYERSLRDLWFSERHVQVIADLLAGQREKYALCRNCPLPPTGPAPAGAKIALAKRERAIPLSPPR